MSREAQELGLEHAEAEQLAGDPQPDADDLNGWVGMFDDGLATVTVTVSRPLPGQRGSKRENLGTLEDLEDPEDEIRQRWGGGTFYCRIRQGGRYKKAVTLRLTGDPLPKESADEPAPFAFPAAAAPGAGGGDAMQMVGALAGAMSAMITPLLAALSERREPPPPAPGLGIGDMIELVRLGQEMGGARGDGMSGLVRTLAPGINSALLGNPPAAAAAPPAPATAPPEPTTPTPEEQAAEMWSNLLDDLQAGIGWGADPTKLAEALADQIPALLRPAATEAVSAERRPQLVAGLLDQYPELGDDRPRLDAVLLELSRILDPPPAEAAADEQVGDG